MPALTIRARFPLGTYLGHTGVGQPSRLPDTARLHAALTHAAGKGAAAVERGGDLRPGGASVVALEWLEDHPPDSLTIPPLVPVAGRGTGALSWRPEGVIEKREGSYRERKTLKRQSGAIAVDGVFAWHWLDAPADIVGTLDALCADVSCLGEADSPVVLEVAAAEPTHDLVDAGGFPPPDIERIATPATGRFAELERDYEVARRAKGPTKARDRSSWGQQPASHVPSATCTRPLSYRPREAPKPDLPWDFLLTLPVADPVSWDKRVRASVTLHRALAAGLGDDAPPVVTGTYPEGTRRPANRVAIQYVEGPTAEPALRRGAFIIAFPQGCSAEVIELVHRAVSRLRAVYLSREQSVRVMSVSTAKPDAFWLPPLPGTTRSWAPMPAMLAETRGGHTRGWGFEESTLLSIGHVFRDALPAVEGRGNTRYAAIVEAVKAWGVVVTDVHRVRDSRIERYVHKAPRDLVVQPYRAKLDLSALVEDTSYLALGQTRHLGGGLLYPVDAVSHGEG